MSRRPSWANKTIAEPPKPIEPDVSEEWEMPDEPPAEKAVIIAPAENQRRHRQDQITLPAAWGNSDEWKTKTITLAGGRTQTTVLRVSCCPNDLTVAEWCDEMDTALMDRHERRAFLESKQT